MRDDYRAVALFFRGALLRIAAFAESVHLRVLDFGCGKGQPVAELTALCLSTFGNCTWPMRFYLETSPGRFAAIARRLPFKSTLAWLAQECRMSFLVMRKV